MRFCQMKPNTLEEERVAMHANQGRKEDAPPAPSTGMYNLSVPLFFPPKRLLCVTRRLVHILMKSVITVFGAIAKVNITNLCESKSRNDN